MFFSKHEIDCDSGMEWIDADIFLERINGEIEKRLMSTKEYSYNKRVEKKDAEDFLSYMYDYFKRE